MILEYLIIGLIGGITIDIVLGDPPNKCHPVAWLGKLIGVLYQDLKIKKNLKREKN